MEEQGRKRSLAARIQAWWTELGQRMPGVATRRLGYGKTPFAWPWDRWSTLRGHGTSRTVRLSIAWFFLVPAAAHVVSLVPDQIDLAIAGVRIPLRAELPVRWQKLFWAATCFASASVLFSLCCPRIIQRFRDLGEFQRAGEDGSHLDDYANELGLDLASEMSPRQEHWEFWTIYREAERARPRWKSVCLGFYVAGYFNLAWAAVENVVAVVALEWRS
jgi:hypothetical protein